MLHIRGDRNSLIAALVNHWLDQTLDLPSPQPAAKPQGAAATPGAMAQPSGQQ
jgi:hypothetical protein